MIRSGCININVEAYVASWIEISPCTVTVKLNSVEAYVASWIEMHGMCKVVFCIAVEAYAASWIEIHPHKTLQAAALSRLTQPRGLKLVCRHIIELFVWSRLTQPR